MGAANVDTRVYTGRNRIVASVQQDIYLPDEMRETKMADDTDGSTGARGESTTLAVARIEGEETFQSISNLDNIGDTAIVGITFLLAALGTWVTFAYPRLSSTPVIRGAFVLLALASVAATLASMYYLVDSLAPRRFYGDGVGDRFLDHKWLPWLNDDPTDLDRFSRTEIDSPADLERAVEEWIDGYDEDTEIDSEAAFQYSRLLNYKLVARHKARNTAYGMAFLRLAVVCLGLVITVGILGGVFGG